MVYTLAVLLFSASVAKAESVTVYVDSRSGPWDISLNPTYYYGTTAEGQPDVHLGPTSVSNASGLLFNVGMPP